MFAYIILWASFMIIWSPHFSILNTCIASDIVSVENNGDVHAADTDATTESTNRASSTNYTKTIQTKEIIDADEEDGIPNGVQFLAGPLNKDDSYSDHSCSCHSYTSSLPLVDPIYKYQTSSGSSVLPLCSSSTNKSHYRKYDNNKNNKEKEEYRKCAARIFYLVSIHNNRTLTDALYLFRAIRDSRNVILFHIDTKFGIEPYLNSTLRKEIEACPCGSHVEVASVHSCKWGSWSMNLPTLWGMEEAVSKKFSGKWEVFINLSGDSLPVYSPNRVARLFGRGGLLNGINFITSSACETGLLPTPLTKFPKKWHKRTHYSHRPAKELEYVDDDGFTHRNVEVNIFFGSQWMSLTNEFCEFIVRQLARSDSLPSRFRDWLIETEKLMSDETFFTSMLMHYFPETIPNVTEGDTYLDNDNSEEKISMYAIRYERMDEHVPTSAGYFPIEQRYEVPDSSGVEKPRPWGPYFLGIYDLYNIRNSGALFVRKVAQIIDPNIYKILPVEEPNQIPPISWPDDVQISPVPDWSKTLDQLRQQAEKKFYNKIVD